MTLTNPDNFVLDNDKRSAALNSFDITREKFSESISKLAFSNLSESFKADGLDFYTDGFYYRFRNNLITSFSNSLTSPSNMVYFLNKHDRKAYPSTH